MEWSRLDRGGMGESVQSSHLRVLGSSLLRHQWPCPSLLPGHKAAGVQTATGPCPFLVVQDPGLPAVVCLGLSWEQHLRRALRHPSQYGPHHRETEPPEEKEKVNLPHLPAALCFLTSGSKKVMKAKARKGFGINTSVTSPNLLK